MARIQGVPETRAPLWAKLVYRLSRRAVSKLTGRSTQGVMEPLTIAAHHRWVMWAYSFFEFALQRSRSLDIKLKELARLKTSTLTGCPW